MTRTLLILLLVCCVRAEVAHGQPRTAVLETLPPCNFSASAPNARVGAVVYHFATGAGCVERLDELFHVASVPKIFIAGAYYDWVIRGLASLNTPYVFNRDYYMAGNEDCLTESDIGNTFRSVELVEKMINCSDNPSTWMLMDAIGWGRVNDYVRELGIDGLSPVLPYSEVDRQKLTTLDERWARVPRALASRYFRRGMVGELTPYFNPLPERLTREQFRTANAHYFATASSNMATPRALAEYFFMLRAAQLDNPNSPNGLIADRLFNVMLYTQRLFSTQGLRGEVLAGSKNGFDMGIVAEVNVLFEKPGSRLPDALIIVFAQQDDLTVSNVQPPNVNPNAPLNRYLAQLSRRIDYLLYGDAPPSPVVADSRLASLTVQTRANIEACWGSYARANFAESQVSALAACWGSYSARQSFARGDALAMGLVLQGLRGADTRFVFVFTAPDGQRYSYQTDRQYQDSSAIYWYHPLTAAGTWRVDIYLNAQRVYSQTVTVS